MNGLLLLDKPTGLTSNAALSRVKRHLKTKKAGFSGTLDPMATGVLPIALGEATKCLPYIEDVNKEYEFTVRWGIETDTLDAEGVVLRTADEQTSRPADEEAIQKIIPQFTGEISQIPPAYSAIKIDGKRAYDLARQGETPEMKPRKVTIHSLEQVEISSARLLVCSSTFRVVCSKGTYIRSLARDMAYALGTLGHLTALRRTRAGAFRAGDCIGLDDFLALPPGEAAARVLSIPEMLREIPRISPSPAELEKLRKGQPIFLDLYPTGTAILLLDNSKAFGIGVMKDNDSLWPKRILIL